jgi:hypothetical protein
MKSFFRHIVSGLHYADSLFTTESSHDSLLYAIKVVCKAYSMPKTASLILAFISNPLTTKQDIEALSKQIYVIYDANVKVAKVVSDAVYHIYEACAKEATAREIYARIEEIAKLNKIKLDEPLFTDMLECKNNPIACQHKRDDFRNTAGHL